jgi:hypothetical protein
VTERWKWAPVSKIKEAAEELKATIRARYPDAQFRLTRASDDRYIWHLWTEVDIEDPEEVKALTTDRELDLLEQEHIPLYVITTRRPRTGENRMPATARKTG